MGWSLSAQNDDARFRAHIFQKRRIHHFSVCGQRGGISEPYPTVVADYYPHMRNVQPLKRRIDADIISGFQAVQYLLSDGVSRNIINFTGMYAQAGDVLTPIRFAVKLLVDDSIVRAYLRRNVPGIAWLRGEPVREEVPAAEIVYIPLGVTNLRQIMQKCCLVMAARQRLDVICQRKAVHAVEIRDKRFGVSGPPMSVSAW